MSKPQVALKQYPVKPKIFERKDLKHPIVAQMSLFKAFDAPVKDAWGVAVRPINEDGTPDYTQPWLMLPMRQLQELLNGTFADGYVQQYEPLPANGKKRQ